MNELRDLLFRLSKAPGTSGQEPVEQAAEELSKYAEVTVDPGRNVIGVMGDKNAKLHIMLDAHLDQIGFTVTQVDDRGFLRIAAVGGLDRRVMAGSAVTVYGEGRFTGVVCCTPPHLSGGGEEKAQPFDQMAVDVGLSADQAKARIPLGSRGTLYREPTELLNRRVSALALDDRAGVAAVIRCAQLLSKEKLSCKVTFLCSAQEETNGGGVKTASFALQPQEAIIVDVSFSKQPSVASVTAAELGKGTMIGISPTLSQEVTDTLFTLAKQKNIPYQTEVMGGATGTNADGAAVSKSGVRCGLLSIPQRSMHTPAEIVSLDDVESTARLMAAYVVERSGQNG